MYLIISIFVFLFNSKIAFSNDLNKNINYLNSTEEELATKYCDAINKKIFNGLNNDGRAIIQIDTKEILFNSITLEWV